MIIYPRRIGQQINCQRDILVQNPIYSRISMNSVDQQRQG
ncbi:type IV secretion protein Rhs [Salmonella enterica]|nr:type IV secretion protein Rhs [Salmonella enterica]ECJ2543045.1 type IV secretion protein Rhs [Salmonella enterica subsp. salamae]EEJ6337735.1 type IV secretion protein Rhs [Salmonella enterica]